MKNLIFYIKVKNEKFFYEKSETGYVRQIRRGQEKYQAGRRRKAAQYKEKEKKSSKYEKEK